MVECRARRWTAQRRVDALTETIESMNFIAELRLVG